MGVQTAMAEMERLEAKGEATPEEIEALAQELSGKMLLTTWKATRWEVLSVSSNRFRPPHSALSMLPDGRQPDRAGHGHARNRFS